jgi:adenosylcobinamide-phosphate synthase
MGWGITRYQRWVFRWGRSPRSQRLAGVLLAIVYPLLWGLVAAGGVVLVGAGSAILAGLLASLLLASCLAGRSLRDAAGDVLGPWQQGDLPQARQRLARYVGRETAELDSPEILRAVLETVSENATDGVLAPLFYGLVGSLGGPPGAVGLAVAYKTLSTLDSMVGYRDAPYTYLGWASARLEDGATWLPCRLTVATLALLSGHPRRVWRLCCRDAPADPSPNAGWSECAYAAALGVQLGGENRYRGQVKWKPWLGDRDRPITPAVIAQALQYTRWACCLWLGLGLGGLGLAYGLHCGYFANAG